LDALRPDLAVVAECGAAHLPSERSLWCGRRKGLGVYTSLGEPRLLEPYVESLRWFLPIAIDGCDEFVLLAAWAFNHRDGLDRCSDLSTAVDRYGGLLSENEVVILGDLNNNVTWDRVRSTPFADAIAALRELGYVSAYHEYFGEPFGAESRPTYRHPGGRTYHIDFCFVPEHWMPRVTIELPSLDAWPSSDHAPLIVDVS